METIRRELGERTWASSWACALALAGMAAIILVRSIT